MRRKTKRSTKGRIRELSELRSELAEKVGGWLVGRVCGYMRMCAGQDVTVLPVAALVSPAGPCLLLRDAPC